MPLLKERSFHCVDIRTWINKSVVDVFCWVMHGFSACVKFTLYQTGHCRDCHHFFRREYTVCVHLACWHSVNVSMLHPIKLLDSINIAFHGITFKSIVNAITTVSYMINECVFLYSQLLQVSDKMNFQHHYSKSSFRNQETSLIIVNV